MYYSTVQSAINSATNVTVKVLANVTESLSIASGKTVTLNLNGKTITYAGRVLDTRGTTTINGSGTLKGTGTSVESSVVNYGTLTLSSITITSSVNALLSNGGTVTINSCTLTGDSTNYTGLFVRGTTSLTKAYNSRITGQCAVQQKETAGRVILVNCTWSGIMNSISTQTAFITAYNFSGSSAIIRLWDNSNRVSSGNVHIRAWPSSKTVSDAVTQSPTKSRNCFTYSTTKSALGNITGAYSAQIFLNDAWTWYEGSDTYSLNLSL